ncbi:hypothetical protein HXX76_004468 [Chlamydomonas incerta]|uniref:phytol kinase n=1 Tax=Chlamydomonas incerta TaxID=51695 RepID=A0A835T7Y1_CHLIN|nr:hypothetical protein HXX76_004468 [Chlamydomonas incerta]|eukprot:KAG2440363.1 hypothetical protein HXX76_004468 [Chlamydomonas incerta]
MRVWVLLGAELSALQHGNPQLTLALLRADTLSLFAQICAALGTADGSDAAAGPSTGRASRNAGSAIPRSAQVAIVFHISYMLETMLYTNNQEQNPPLSELVAALQRSQLLEHLTGAIVRLSAALPPAPAALPAAGTPVAACVRVVEAAACVFQATAVGPGHLRIAQPPVGYRPVEAPARPRLRNAATAASAGGNSARVAPPVVPYAAVAVYDVLFAAWATLGSSCDGGGGGGGGGGGQSHAFPTMMAMLSRLLTELQPRQAAARLPGLWREALVPQIPVMVSKGCSSLWTGELLRLQVPAPPQVAAQAGAAADTPWSAGPASYSSYSLRCALDAGLLPALERALRNEQAWVTGQGTDGSGDSSGPGGASGTEFKRSPVDVSDMLHELNCMLRYTGVWPAALAHAPPAQVVGLVATLTAAARRLQQARHAVLVGRQQVAGHLTLEIQCESGAFVALCGYLAALLEQGLDLAADASGAVGEEHSSAPATSGPSCRRHRWCLRLNNALEPLASAPMQLGWLAAAGGAPPVGSAAAAQRDWLFAFAVQQWLPLLLQCTDAAIRGTVLQADNAAGADRANIHSVPAWVSDMAVVVLRAAGELLTAALLATVQAAEKAAEGRLHHQDGASGDGGAAACKVAAQRELVSSWPHVMALVDSAVMDLEGGELRLLVGFVFEHTELWAGNASARAGAGANASRQLQDGEDGGGNDADSAELEGCVLDALEVFWLHWPVACAELLYCGRAEDGSSSSSRRGNNSSSPSGGTQAAAQAGGGLSEVLPLRELAARHGRSELLQLMEAASAAADEAAELAAATPAAAGGTKPKVRVNFEPPAAVMEGLLQRLVRRTGSVAVGEAGSDGRARRRAWRLVSPAEVQQQVRAALAAAAAAAAPSAAPPSGAAAAGSGSGGGGAATAAVVRAAAPAAALCANPACSSLEGPSALVLAGRGKTCSRCREARYCCGVCQLQHWREGGHDRSCAGVVAAAAGSVSISSGGVSVVWEDDSKSLQGSVFLKPELFSRFECGAEDRHEFGIQLQLLLDTLSVFASAAAPMTAHYPGPQGELVCEMSDPTLGGQQQQQQQQQRPALGLVPAGTGPGAVCTWARIAALEAEAVVDLGAYWTEPASSFLCPGSALKEAVDDLEWPGGPLELALVQDPPRLLLAASGHGSLEVELPPASISGFNCCVAPEVRHAYKYRHCKAAFCNLPHPKDCAAISTKVSIDAQGLLKVTHMLGLDPAPHGPRGGLAADNPSALLESQRLYDGAKVAVVQFLLQPTDEEGVAA